MTGPRKRLLATFVGMWFLLVILEPESVHSCPVHSAHAAASHSSHTSHHSAAAGHHQSKDKSAATCSCPGDCTAGAPSVLPSKAHHFSVSAVRNTAANLPRGLSTELEQPDFLLPFAIGPPAVVAA